EPFKGCWALPGGFINMDETAEESALRELFEETGIRNIFLEQFHVFSDVLRDPRERVLTIAFLALVRKSDYQVIAGDDAAAARWFVWDELPPLAFDHAEIIRMGKKSLQLKLRTEPIAFKLLNNEFSMSELQRIYETIHETTYDRRNFARKMAASGLLREVTPMMEEYNDESCIGTTEFMCRNNEIGNMRDEADLPEPECLSYAPNGSFNEFILSKESKPEEKGVRGRKPVMFSFDEEEFEKMQQSQDRHKFPLDF
ncbi:MAG: NUDIX hydrolase, partial [Bacteroidales bacterium]|nr:NUDIX hydrolase [Bacteroidales bacterium]